MPVAIVSPSNPSPSVPAGQWRMNSIVQLVLEGGPIRDTNDPYLTLAAETAPMPMSANATQVRAAITTAVIAAVNAARHADGTLVVPAGIVANDVFHTASYSRG